jgi:hypothetical protein
MIPLDIGGYLMVGFYFFIRAYQFCLMRRVGADMVITHENALGQVLYQNSVLPLATTLGGHLLLVTALPHEKRKRKTHPEDV